MIIDNSSTIRIYLVKVSNMFVTEYDINELNSVESVSLAPDITDAKIISDKDDANLIAKYTGGKVCAFLEDHWAEKSSK